MNQSDRKKDERAICFIILFSLFSFFLSFFPQLPLLSTPPPFPYSHAIGHITHGEPLVPAIQGRLLLVLVLFCKPIPGTRPLLRTRTHRRADRLETQQWQHWQQTIPAAVSRSIKQTVY